MPESTFSREPEDRTILIYRLGSLGDTIVALPCLHKIAERFPRSRRVMLTNMPVSKAAPRLQDVLQGSGLVHDTIEYPVGTRSPRELLGVWRQLRRVGAGTLVYLAAPRGQRSLRRDLLFFRACGLKTILAAPVRPDLLTSRIDAHGEEEFECERLARCVSVDLGPIDLASRRSWDLGLTTEERRAAARTCGAFADKPFVAVNMGGKAAWNDWGRDNWAALLPRLVAAFGNLHWIFIGAAQDAERADALVAQAPERMMSLCGRLSIRETAALLSQAVLFTGHDSGPLHLAAACGIRCVGIFGNANRAHKWYPYGQSHRVLRSPMSIGDITVEDVFIAVKDMLNRSPES